MACSGSGSSSLCPPLAIGNHVYLCQSRVKTMSTSHPKYPTACSTDMTGIICIDEWGDHSATLTRLGCQLHAHSAHANLIESTCIELSCFSLSVQVSVFDLMFTRAVHMFWMWHFTKADKFNADRRVYRWWVFSSTCLERNLYVCVVMCLSVDAPSEAV